MDLLRVAVAGPAGTPYADGLFVFDLQLPPGYPAAPPRCFFHCLGAPSGPRGARAASPT